MADDFLDEAFTDDETGAAPVVEPEPPAPEPEPEAEAITPEQKAPEVEPEPIVADEPKSGPIPIAALMDERDKRKAAEERIRILEAQQAQPPPSAAPDPYDDLAGYNAYQDQRIATALQTQKVEMSWQLAVRDHGADKVEAAKQWALEKAQSDPAFNSALEVEFQRQALPVDWIVQQHKRDGLYSQLPTDVSSLEELIEREIAKRGLTAPLAAAAGVAASPQQAATPVKVPRSLATKGSAPSDIRHVASGPLAGFDAEFS